MVNRTDREDFLMLTHSLHTPNSNSRFHHTRKIFSNPESTVVSKEALEDWGSAIDESEKNLE